MMMISSDDYGWFFVDDCAPSMLREGQMLDHAHGAGSTTAYWKYCDEQVQRYKRYPNGHYFDEVKEREMVS
jgi:hypothetical protein